MNGPSQTDSQSLKDVDRAQKQMRVRILAAGCFDLLHYGHLRYLEEAKKLGGKRAELIVVVARDSTILRRKGRLPVMKEEHRRVLVEALKPVDSAILGGADMDTARVIRDVKPDIIALGYDQDDLAALIMKEDPTAKVIHIGKYGDLSSSKIKAIVHSSAGKRFSQRGPSAGPDPHP